MSSNHPLWIPTDTNIENSNMNKYLKYINKTYELSLKDYDELYEWSISNYEEFWKTMWDYSGLKYSKKYDSITKERESKDFNIPRPNWFVGAKLNFAENLLKFRDDRRAITFWTEGKEPEYISYKELYGMVARCSLALKNSGIKKGDRVAGYISNCPEAIIAMLATTSLGAIWSSSSPDFGFNGVMDRFGQIKPKILVASNGYNYGGKEFSNVDKVNKIEESIDSIEKVVLINQIEDKSELANTKFIYWDEFNDNSAKNIEFEQVDFDHPVYIMYSSGTTGTPKCIVHGVGGTLLQHYKELALHTDLTRDDNISYFTTCGWMMWNWLVSSLQIGANVFLFDGSPGYPNMNRLWDAVEQESLTVFGTSPKFLTTSQKSKIVPRESHDLSSLKSILSTGSPLSNENFEYVYKDVKKDIRLSSITGGTDIISCFALGNPMLPVYSEELQCRGLGMAVESWDENKNSLLEEQGEMVCTMPFPSMPIYFWNDEEDEKYYSAYFDYFEGIWRHGDFIKITKNGGMIVLGRSDATLNPGGIRIGTAEIYRTVEAMEEIKDSIVVGQKYDDDVRVILFIVLQEGYELDKGLKKKIKDNIKREATPRHVPKKIKAITEVPITISGKKVELAVTRILNKEKVTNKSALANPESLEQFHKIEL